MKAVRRSSLGILALWLGLILALGGCASSREKTVFVPTAPEIRLVELMAKRLEIGRHVAWVKFQNNAPVSDPKREAELLASLVSQGAKRGVEAVTVETFFAAQIKASRELQAELIHDWKRGATLPAYPPWDLRKHIRPKLDAISSEMLGLLAEGAGTRKGMRDYAASVLKQRGFSWSVRRAAVAPLL